MTGRKLIFPERRGIAEKNIGRAVYDPDRPLVDRHLDQEGGRVFSCEHGLGVHGETDSVEGEFHFVFDHAADCPPLGRKMAFKSDLGPDGPGALDGDSDLGVADPPPVPTHVFQGMFEGQVGGVVERYRGIGKGLCRNPLQAFCPCSRNIFISEHRPQNSARRGRVAVRIVAATGADGQGLAEIPFAEEEPEENPGGVDFGVDVEARKDALGAAAVFRPELLDPAPRLFPVGRIFAVPADDVPHGSGESRFRGNRFQGFGGDELDVVRDEGQSIHGRDVDAAIPAVAVGHDMPDLVADFGGGVRNSGRHQSGEIRFDLKVDVVGVRILEPMAGFGRKKTVEDIIAGHLVGVP
jgi:hypothetical protein